MEEIKKNEEVNAEEAALESATECISLDEDLHAEAMNHAYHQQVFNIQIAMEEIRKMITAKYEDGTEDKEKPILERHQYNLSDHRKLEALRDIQNLMTTLWDEKLTPDKTDPESIPTEMIPTEPDNVVQFPGNVIDAEATPVEDTVKSEVKE